MPEPETLVVATDLSDPSLAAVRKAAELARRLGGSVVLTYVMDDHLPPLILAHSAQPVEDILTRHRAHAGQSLADLAANHLAGLPVETVVRDGNPAKEIAALARERDASMIVVGMHGHGFLGHAFAGNTAERVLHHATCPVLIVPHSA